MKIPPNYWRTPAAGEDDRSTPSNTQWLVKSLICILAHKLIKADIAIAISK